ncbi:MAG: molybdenum cofactor guanylyltransferase [Chloroflexi bacterium]|nr:molybdenum cofactor guanylyltransferase [Chloroflexota bacterium]
MRLISGIVLAGGQSQRMGTDKALLQMDGQPLIGWVLERLQQLSDDLIIVAKDTAPYTHLGARLVTDAYPGQGVLVGLHAGLKAARYPRALAVACDMPFLDLRLLRYMIVAGRGHDAVLPRIGGYPEPLHGLYRVKSCLPAIEQALDSGQFKMTSFLPSVQVRYVEEHEVGLFDPQHLSFFNVNTPEDWERGQKLARQLRRQRASRRKRES